MASLPKRRASKRTRKRATSGRATGGREKSGAVMCEHGVGGGALSGGGWLEVGVSIGVGAAYAETSIQEEPHEKTVTQSPGGRKEPSRGGGGNAFLNFDRA